MGHCCIHRLETPTSGKIYVDGKETTDKKCKVHLLRRKIEMNIHHNAGADLSSIEDSLPFKLAQNASVEIRTAPSEEDGYGNCVKVRLK